MEIAAIRSRLLNELPLFSWDLAQLPDAVRVEESGLVFDDRAQAIREMFPAAIVWTNKPFIYIKPA